MKLRLDDSPTSRIEDGITKKVDCCSTKNAALKVNIKFRQWSDHYEFRFSYCYSNIGIACFCIYPYNWKYFHSCCDKIILPFHKPFSTRCQACMVLWQSWKEKLLTPNAKKRILDQSHPKKVSLTVKCPHCHSTFRVVHSRIIKIVRAHFYFKHFHQFRSFNFIVLRMYSLILTQIRLR